MGTSISFGKFFLPGPTEVDPAVLRAMDRAVIGHRTSDLSSLLAEIDPMLRRIFRTERPVYVSSSSATGFMEAGVRNGVRRRALALVNGAFSERFRDLVTACGREVEVYDVEWGGAHDPEEVERRLRVGGFDSVTVVHSETSSGVLNPLRQIADAVRSAEHRVGEEILLLVDGVTSVGGGLVESGEWALDWILTGSQKALALPPGLAFGSASPRMLARAETLPGRGQYFDLLEFDRYWKKHQTPNTPAVHLLFALKTQMERIEAEGIEARAARHQAMARRCWSWVESTGAAHGLSLFAPEGARSLTVTAISLPTDLRGTEITAKLKRRGYTIGSGYGKLRDQTIRIGHMGDHTMEGLNQLLTELEEVLGE
ncbi:MAG: aminotransferase class V-fold PLP-dependent enzyme [Gemmatimonas sp.]|nr:aminotransferase class V-fold PLP-dependent enzyme [Gemmatimonas sp.]